MNEPPPRRHPQLPEDRFLVAVLGERLALALLDGYPLERLTVGSVEYIDMFGLDMNGFYDWLYNYSGELVGVRFFPMGKAEQVFRDLAARDYLSVAPDGLEADILFYPVPRGSVVGDGSQEFLDNRVLASAAGVTAVTFGIKHLGGDDRARLVAAVTATWPQGKSTAAGEAENGTPAGDV